MKIDDKKTALVTREEILKMLSDEENAKVASAEARDRLGDGDDYLDLEHLDKGVCRAHGNSAPMAHVLPRKAVREATWYAIMKQLAPH